MLSTIFHNFVSKFKGANKNTNESSLTNSVVKNPMGLDIRISPAIITEINSSETNSTIKSDNVSNSVINNTFNIDKSVVDIEDCKGDCANCYCNKVPICEIKRICSKSSCSCIDNSNFNNTSINNANCKND